MMCDTQKENQEEKESRSEKPKKYSKKIVSQGEKIDGSSFIKLSPHQFQVTTPQILNCVKRYTVLKAVEAEDAVSQMRPYVVKGAKVEQLRGYLLAFFDRFSFESKKTDNDGVVHRTTHTVYRDLPFRLVDEKGNYFGKEMRLDTKITLVEAILHCLAGEDPFKYKSLFKKEKVME